MNMFTSLCKKSKRHLNDTGWGYWKHLRHAFKQSNRLIIAALKSYVHGILPSVWIADGPKTIVKIYREVKRLKHHDNITK